MKKGQSAVVETPAEGSRSECVMEVPLPDGIVYSKSKGIRPNGPPFSLSSLEDYLPIVGEEKIEKLVKAAEKVKGIHILELNSTSLGGGVAEMLLSRS